MSKTLERRLRELEVSERDVASSMDMDPRHTANWEYAETAKDALARIATLESDERRRIAGQILAGMCAITGVATGSGIAYTTRKQALEMADAVIRKLDATKGSQS